MTGPDRNMICHRSRQSPKEHQEAALERPAPITEIPCCSSYSRATADSFSASYLFFVHGGAPRLGSKPLCLAGRRLLRVRLWL